MTIEQLFNFFVDLLVWEVEHFDIGEFVTLITSGTFIGTKYVQLMYVFFWGMIILGSKFFGRDVKKLQKILQAYTNDSNPDHEFLCDECPDLTWTHTIDFTASNGGFSVYNPSVVSGAHGSWTSGQGWNATNASHSNGVERRQVWIRRTIPTTTITNMKLTYNLSKGTYTSNETALLNQFSGTGNSKLASVLSNGTGTVDDTGVIAKTGTVLEFMLLSSRTTNGTYSGSARIVSIELSGIGSNPFA
jgi:hypothetical protein